MKSSCLLLLIVMAFTTPSCTRDNDDSGNNQTQIQNVSTGNWRVTLFTDSGNDETSDFTGYSFQFNTSGTVAATRSGVSQNGIWNINSSSTKFNLDLGAKIDTNRPLGELTDDWQIISISNTEIKLTDDNPASNEFLTFTKN